MLANRVRMGSNKISDSELILYDNGEKANIWSTDILTEPRFYKINMKPNNINFTANTKLGTMSLSTINKINISKYNKVNINWINNAKHYNWITLGLGNSRGLTKRYRFEKGINIIQDSPFNIIRAETMDISDLKGEYYLTMLVDMLSFEGDEKVDFEIHKIWLS